MYAVGEFTSAGPPADGWVPPVSALHGALGMESRDPRCEHGDGLFVTTAIPDDARDFDRVCYLIWGTVLDDGESADADRVRAAAGPGWALAYHGTYELGGDLDALPGGPEWHAAVERIPEEDRHMAVHDRHCIALNDADRTAWDAGGHAMLDAVTITGRPRQVRERLAAAVDQGVTEVVFQPCGPDPARELEAFARAARSTAVAS